MLKYTAQLDASGRSLQTKNFRSIWVYYAYLRQEYHPIECHGKLSVLKISDCAFVKSVKFFIAAQRWSWIRQKYDLSTRKIKITCISSTSTNKTKNWVVNIRVKIIQLYGDRKRLLSFLHGPSSTTTICRASNCAPKIQSLHNECGKKIVFSLCGQRQPRCKHAGTKSYELVELKIWRFFFGMVSNKSRCFCNIERISATIKD